MGKDKVEIMKLSRSMGVGPKAGGAGMAAQSVGPKSRNGSVHWVKTWKDMI